MIESLELVALCAAAAMGAGALGACLYRAATASYRRAPSLCVCCGGRKDLQWGAAGCLVVCAMFGALGIVGWQAMELIVADVDPEALPADWAFTKLFGGLAVSGGAGLLLWLGGRGIRRHECRGRCGA